MSAPYEAAVQREFIDMAAKIGRLEDMSRAAFLNRLRSLFNVDRDQLLELTWGEWARFREDPVRFFMAANEVQAAAIWREVERRQRVTA